ncbi:MAG TPA: hypothetical protein VF103_09745, partial [Polyangiaceae bacterium]
LLTGRYLHAASLQRNLVVAAATEPAPPVLSMEPGIPAALAELIDRAVRMKKEERWPNARAMLAALQALDLPVHSDIRPIHAAPIVEDAGISTAASSLMSWSHASAWLRRAEPGSRRALVGMLMGVVTVAVAVAVVVFSLRSSTGASTAGDASTTSKPEPPSPSAAAREAPMPDAPVTPSRESTTPERQPATPAPKQLAMKAPAFPKSVSKPARTPAPRASATESAPDLSVPDEVLDRRE